MSLLLEIITPEKVVFSNKADSVVLPTNEGDVGIQGKFSVEKVGRAFIRAVNKCKKIHVEAEKFYDDDDPGTVFPVKLIQQKAGSSGNTPIDVTGSVNVHIKSPVSASDGANIVGSSRVQRYSGHGYKSGFQGGNDLKVVYPMKFSIQSFLHLILN